MATSITSRDAGLMAAREVAQQVIHERFPELDGVEPHVSLRAPQTALPSDAQRLGIAVPPQTPAEIEYIFTFTRELRTPEGYHLPRVARVTVDTKQRVVKAVHSK